MWDLLAGEETLFKLMLSGEGVHSDIVQRVSG